MEPRRTDLNEDESSAADDERQEGLQMDDEDSRRAQDLAGTSVTVSEAPPGDEDPPVQTD